MHLEGEKLCLSFNLLFHIHSIPLALVVFGFGGGAEERNDECSYHTLETDATWRFYGRSYFKRILAAR